MKFKKNKKEQIEQKVNDVISAYNSTENDKLGMYTGTPSMDSLEKPVQDADDL